jgi:hydrogenase maturation protease
MRSGSCPGWRGTHAGGTHAGQTPRANSVIVIGAGNALRHDDAAGLEAIRRLRAVTSTAAAQGQPAAILTCEQEGEPLGLLDAWDGAAAVVLVDAIHGAAPAGAIHRFDASARPLPSTLAGSSSTHAIGLAEAIELGRALGRLPRKVVVYGVVGARFDAGCGLSREVQAVIGGLAEALLREARELA